MSQLTVWCACAIGILGLFAFERDRKIRTSWALWIPTIWVLIACSRFVSQWLSNVHVENTQQQIEGSPLDALIFGALMVAAILTLLCRERRVLTILKMNWPILIFFIYCALSVFWSHYPDVAFKRWVKAVGDPIMVLVVLTDKDRIGATKTLLARVAFLLIPLSIMLIEYYPNLGLAYSPESAMTTYTGVTTNKNSLGMLCLIVGLASAWRLISLVRSNRFRTKHLIAQGTILVMTFWLLYIADAMTALGCFLLGLGLLALLSLPRKGRPVRVHLAVGAVIFSAVVVFILPDAFAYVVNAFGRNTTLSGRTRLWEVLITMNTNPWFGTGFASFWLGNRLDKLWGLFNWLPGEAHNGYLGVWLELGWVGLFLLTLVLVTGYRNVVAAFRCDPEVGSLRLVFLVVALVYNFTDSGFRMLMPVWIFLLWAIIAVPDSPSGRGLDVSKAADSDRSEYALHDSGADIYEESVSR